MAFGELDVLNTVDGKLDELITADGGVKGGDDDFDMM